MAGLATQEVVYRVGRDLVDLVSLVFQVVAYQAIVALGHRASLGTQGHQLLASQASQVVV